MRLVRLPTHLNMTVHVWQPGDLTLIPTSPNFGIGSNQPPAQPGEQSAPMGMWKHNFMQHSNKTKYSRAIWLFPFYSGFRMFALLLRRMFGANTAKNRLKEGGLESRRPRKATFVTARHKQERLRLAYNFNVLGWPALAWDMAPIEHIWESSEEGLMPEFHYREM